MIKIQLSKEKKAEIERLLLEDLVGTFGVNQQGKRGKLIEDLDTKESRDLLQADNHALYQYLYDKAGKPNVENVKALLLANRRQMEEFIGQFGTYHSFEKANNLLNAAFRYTNFSNRKVVNKILQEMEMPVCPYCNRLYITVLKKGKVRPQLDHFFPKSKYPYLALSLYNLVPSCGVCNQAKSDLDTLREPLLYPYEEEFGKEFVFALDLADLDDFVQKMRGGSPHIQVRIHSTVPGGDLKQKVELQNERLHLLSLYQEHGDYIADILRSYHINTKARVDELLRRFPDLFTTPEEVWSLMLMNPIEKNRWGKRPLAKLTHDIRLELDSLLAHPTDY